MTHHLLPNNWPTQASIQDHEWLLPPLVDLSADAYGTHERMAAQKNGILYLISPPNAKMTLEQCSPPAGLPAVYTVAAMTQGLEGTRLSDMLAWQKKGAVAVSHGWDNNCCDEVLLRTLEYAKSFDLKVFFYPNSKDITKQGVVHDGYVASYHGLAGIPALSETVALSKQLLMVEHTGVQAHFCQLSCQRSVEMIRHAKASGLSITCDVAMHQLYLTEQAVIGFDSNAYVLPPLRGEEDRQALRQGVKDGTIDAICSHHRPTNQKFAPFDECQAGISTFDSFVPLACQLVAEGLLTLDELVQKISINPAKIAGITTQWQQQGGAVVIDPTRRFCLTSDTMASAGHNTPFLHQTLTGQVVAVIT